MLDTPTKPYDEEAVSNQMDAAQSNIADVARKSRMSKSLLKQCVLQNQLCMRSYQFGTAVTPYLYQRTHCC